MKSLDEIKVLKSEGRLRALKSLLVTVVVIAAVGVVAVSGRLPELIGLGVATLLFVLFWIVVHDLMYDDAEDILDLYTGPYLDGQE